ncbi:MAG TPA: DUF6624 domain-containing protein [Blastocatellia bacterium]|nr:DUF6624 domain-containing protein [Blastocatellia bacterium]
MPAEGLRKELLEMAAEDRRVREELAADGSLFEGYHPRMEAVHRRNAARLVAIMEEYGWPGCSLVGEDGEEAAWLIAQHAIGDPPLQRRGLELIRQAAAQGETPAWQAAMLEDRIRMFEGKPQLYGTQYDWDENGLMSPCPIEDAERVDERRLAVGLGPLEENTRRVREGVARSKEQPPRDCAARQKEMDEWARVVGWRR